MYQLGGEFFAGSLFPNKDNGKIYFALGKYTPLLYEAKGWSLRDNPVRRLTDVQSEVTISAAQIAQPPEIALTLRGGSGAAKFARFWPALGDVAFDGSMVGWESAEPINFQADKDQSVEVRGLYQPDQLLLRWHARLATKFAAQALAAPRANLHARSAGRHAQLLHPGRRERQAGRAAPRDAGRRALRLRHLRPGRQARNRWRWGCIRNGAGTPAPPTRKSIARRSGRRHSRMPAPSPTPGWATQSTPTAKASFWSPSIPRAAIPRLQQPFAGGLQTLVNFEATFGGHGKFWWANSDGSASRETYDEPTEARLYPGSWAPIQLQGIEGGVVIHNWLIAGPFGGPGAEKLAKAKGPEHDFSRQQPIRRTTANVTLRPSSKAT